MGWGEQPRLRPVTCHLALRPLNVNAFTLPSPMSSTRQATSSTSNVQLIIDAALADYTKHTGIDLSKTPFAAALEQSNSPEAILQLLYDRENAFKEHRDRHRRLINCLSPAVNVIQAFSGIIGEAANLVSLTCPSGYFLTMTSSDFLLTSIRFVCCHRFPPCCTSFNAHFNPFPVMNEYSRLPVGLHRATMLFSSCLSAWGISSSVWRSIR